MKCQVTFLGFALAFAACNTPAGSDTKTLDTTAQSTPLQATVRDTTPKVTGIGGIFFGSEDPKSAREWYGKNLGLAIDDYGSPFEFRNAHRPDEVNYLRWSPFKKGSDYLKPSKQEFMINYRVQNLDGLLRKLKANGVTIVDTVTAVDYGKFVHILDAEGNKIELREPVDSVLTRLGGTTTK